MDHSCREIGQSHNNCGPNLATTVVLLDINGGPFGITGDPFLYKWLSSLTTRVVLADSSGGLLNKNWSFLKSRVLTDPIDKLIIYAL